MLCSMPAPAIRGLRANKPTTQHSSTSKPAWSSSWQPSPAAPRHSHAATLASAVTHCAPSQRSWAIQPCGPPQQHGCRHTEQAHRRCRPLFRQAAHQGQGPSSATDIGFQSPAAAWAQPLDDPWAALLMAWFASRKRSRLAAQCLVEATLQLYMSGNTFTQVQLGLKLASWGARQASSGTSADGRSGASDDSNAGTDEETSNWTALLGEQDESELLCVVALVMTAAQLAGLQPITATEGQTAPALTAQGDSAGERYLRGMQGFVKQAYGMWQGGMTLQRLLDLQNAASQAQQMSAVQYTMQQYTRIAITALDLMAAERLIPMPTAPSSDSASGAASSSIEHEDEEASTSQIRLRPTGYTATFVNGPIVCQLPSAASEASGGVPAARRLAVRIAVGFMGAVLSGAIGYEADKFVESVYMAYYQGWTASEILAQITEDDLSQTGGLVAVAASSTAEPGQSPAGLGDDDRVHPEAASAGGSYVNKQLFASWLSTVYMALAQLGAAFPEGSQRPGWAWAGMGDATEAAGLDAFVQGALRRSILQIMPATKQAAGIQPPFKATSSIEDPSRTPTPTPQPSETAASMGSAGSLPVSVPLPRSSLGNPLQGKETDTAVQVTGAQGAEAGQGLGNEDVGLPVSEPAVDLLDPFMARVREDTTLAERLQQERRAAAEEYASTGKLRGKSIPDMLIRLQDDELAMTSSAIKLLSAQTQLVRATLALAVRLQQQPQQQ